MKRLFLLLLVTVSLNAADQKGKTKSEKQHDKSLGELLKLQEQLKVKKSLILEILRLEINNEASYEQHKDRCDKLMEESYFVLLDHKNNLLLQKK